MWGMLWLEGWDCPGLFSPTESHLYFIREHTRSGSRNESKGMEHHLLLMQEETIQLIAHISLYRPSRAAVIILNKREEAVRHDGGRQLHSSTKEKKVILILHYTFLSKFLSLRVPLSPPPLPYSMMVSLLPGNLLCDVVHTSIEPKRKKKL